MLIGRCCGVFIQDDDPGNAFIFKKNEVDGTWQNHQKLWISAAKSWNGFGQSIAMTDDYMAIGAPVADSEDGSIVDAGALYIYARLPNDTFAVTQKIYGCNTRFAGYLAM